MWKNISIGVFILLIIISLGYLFLSSDSDQLIREKSSEFFDKDISQELEYVLKNEGGVSNHPQDTGGYTVYGISKIFNPDINLSNISLIQVKEIYEKRYWFNTKIPFIVSDIIRLKIFDTCVLMGYTKTTFMIQRTLKAMGRNIEIDGFFGKQTLKSINEFNDKESFEKAFLSGFIVEMVNTLEQLATREPKNKVFLQGWLNRAYRLP